MTVETTSTYAGPYTGNGVTTTFPFSFTAGSAAELNVLIDGVEVDSSSYTVTLNAGNEGGSVVMGSAPAAGTEIFIESDPLFTQDIDFENAGAFLPESHTEGLDRGVLRDQWLKERVDRSLLVARGSSGLQIPAPVASRFLYVDANLDPQWLEGSGVEDGLRADLATSAGASLVSYLPGTGLDAMNVQTALRLGLPVMPEHYGAVGDGVADDTDAVQAAIESGAARIYLKNTYAITGVTLNQQSDIHIFGLGTLLMTGAPVNGTHALTIIQCDRITVEGVTIHGQNETRGAVAGAQNLSIYGSTNCELRNVKSIYSSSDGLYLNRAATGATVNGVAMGDAVSKNIRVVGCVFDYACRQGMSGIAFEGAVLENSSFSNVGQSSAGVLAPAAGIDLEANDTVSHFPLRTVIRGCRFYNNAGSGITVNGRASETTIEGCHIEGGTSYGISNAGSRTYVRNTIIKNTGATSRPSINNQSQAGYERASLTVENCWIVGAIQGGITSVSYCDLTIRNVRVSDGANYALRLLSGGTDSGDGDKGFCTVERLIAERLYENNPPTNINYLGGSSYDGNLILRKVRLVRTGATGTPIERGINLTGFTNVQEVTDLNVVGTFATTTASGLNVAKVLRNNQLDTVVTDSLNMVGSATYDPPSIAAAGTTTTNVAVTGAALGESYRPTFSLSLAGLVMTAYVSAVNTVTVVLFNPTAAPVDLASGTLTVTRVA